MAFLQVQLNMSFKKIGKHKEKRSPGVSQPAVTPRKQEESGFDGMFQN